jgi:hypothetical protein
MTRYSGDLPSGGSRGRLRPGGSFRAARAIALIWFASPSEVLTAARSSPSLLLLARGMSPGMPTCSAAIERRACGITQGAFRSGAVRTSTRTTRERGQPASREHRSCSCAPRRRLVTVGSRHPEGCGVARSAECPKNAWEDGDTHTRSIRGVSLA